MPGGGNCSDPTFSLFPVRQGSFPESLYALDTFWLVLSGMRWNEICTGAFAGTCAPGFLVSSVGALHDRSLSCVHAYLDGGKASFIWHDKGDKAAAMLPIRAVGGACRKFLAEEYIEGLFWNLFIT